MSELFYCISWLVSTLRGRVGFAQ
ncbi:hypothetical protein R3I93_001544 [Phoxinus phoxinus]|uniref:Uncharacterized protein n=1 Tax=Phoxinus phoxinus TaxID=58324 RepID=A0AAN9DKP9_9TELE